MNNELRVGDWECKVYCDKHKITGKKFVKVLKSAKIAQGKGEIVDEETERRHTRLQVEK